MLRSGSRPLSVGVLVSMPGRWAVAPHDSAANGAAPHPIAPSGPEGYWTEFLDSSWTLDQFLNAFRLGIRGFRA